MGKVEDRCIRVRFAPSPTGSLHIGSARTALFDWLFARHYKGTFILRIEDTDVTRSKKEAIDSIIEGLNWLGLQWDEGPIIGGNYGPYFQSERLEIYRRYAQMLLEKGEAYYCYCTPEELKAKREAALSLGKAPGYDGSCRNLSPEEVNRYEGRGRKPVIRIRIPPGKTEFEDLIRGKVSFENELLDDFVILKSDGTPTYNFAVVIDDLLMEISHIIRGEDHISNTPRQLILYQKLDLKPPKFAHIPLILGKDRTKLSKRHGATSVTEYRDRGYLPEAVVNYLALLGWSYDGVQEIFSIEELIEKFSLEKVSKNPAIFDIEKLDWMNGQYIRKADLVRLTELAIPYLKAAGFITEITPEKLIWIQQVVKSIKDRMRNLSQIVDLVDFYFVSEIQFNEEAVERILLKKGVAQRLEIFKKRLERSVDFNETTIERIARNLIAELEIKSGDLIHPTRVALTGRMVSPGLFEMMAILGKERVLSRLERIIQLINDRLAAQKAKNSRSSC